MSINLLEFWAFYRHFDFFHGLKFQVNNLPDVFFFF